MEKDFERTIDALNEIFPLVDGFLSEHGIVGDDALAIRLAVEELFTNLVRHNSGGRDQISLALEREGDRLIIRLTDFDVDEFDPSKIAIPNVDRPITDR
jgi:anti-sigma regulatory factor (Ser/Thr protein kinase)